MRPHLRVLISRIGKKTDKMPTDREHRLFSQTLASSFQSRGQPHRGPDLQRAADLRAREFQFSEQSSGDMAVSCVGHGSRS